MDSIIKWFTPKKRKAIYAIVAVCAASLVTFGVISQDQLNSTIQNVSGVIAMLTALLAAANVNDE